MEVVAKQVLRNYGQSANAFDTFKTIGKVQSIPSNLANADKSIVLDVETGLGWIKLFASKFVSDLIRNEDMSIFQAISSFQFSKNTGEIDSQTGRDIYLMHKAQGEKTTEDFSGFSLENTAKSVDLTKYETVSMTPARAKKLMVLGAKK
jgi:hypothetical protein